MVVLGQKETSFRSLLNGWKTADKSADHAPLRGLAKSLGSLGKHNRPAIQQYRSRRGLQLDKKQSSRRSNVGDQPTRLREVFGVKVKKADVTSFRNPVFGKTESEIDLIRSTLKESFIFDQMEHFELKSIVQGFEPLDVSDGQKVFQQGEQADYFYIISEGEVEFQVDDKTVGAVGPGKSFGDLALLHKQPRTSTAIVKSANAKLFRLDQKTFSSISQKHAKEVEESKKNLLATIDFLRDVSRYDLNRLAHLMKPKFFRKDEVLVKCGDDGNWFCIIQEGEVKVHGSSGNTEDKIVKSGSYVGEQSILTGEVATTNVTAVTNGTAYSIDRRTFEQVLGKFSRVIMGSQKRRALERLKVFQELNLEGKQFDELTNLMFDETYNARNVIFKSGKVTEAALYFVYEGNIQLSGSRTELIKPGMFFGEEHLDTSKIKPDASTIASTSMETVATYSATVTDKTCICAVLTLSDCLFVFPPSQHIEELSVSNNMSFSSLNASFNDDEMLAAAMAPPSLTLEPTTTANWLQEHSRENIRQKVRSQVNLDDLDRMSMLGEGQFGEVFLVRPMLNTLHNQHFALKIQAKADDIRRGEAEELISREIHVLEQMDHPYIVNLVHHYEDPKNFYILMGIVPGGELFDVIHQEDENGEWSSGLIEEDAKFYAMMVADTLNYIHRREYVYRDLKPENVLIDQDGYPVLCDLGFAKYLPAGEESYTLCGTPNYLAPEIVMSRGHGYGVDHWSLGILIYEMIMGENPFYFEDMEQMALFHAISHEDYYPLAEDVSAEAKDLIDGLLIKDPMHRLGSLAGRGKDILNKPWFDSLNLRDLRKKRFKAPFVPAKDTLDTIIDDEEETDGLL